MATTSQQPQLGDAAEEAVDVSVQKPAAAFQQGTAMVFGGSDQEREVDLLTFPVESSRLNMSGNTVITDDPEIPESDSSNGEGRHNDHGDARESAYEATERGGDTSSGGGSHASCPRSSNSALNSLFEGLNIEQLEGKKAAKADGGNDRQGERREVLHTRIQGLENYIEHENSKRLEAESRAETLERELQAVEDRWGSEIAAREAAEANAERYMGLFTEARAAWQNTQGIVENKERQLAAAEKEINRDVGDFRSMQSRLEEARKGKELARQHSLALKQALEGPLAGGGTFSAAPSAAAVAAVPSAQGENKVTTPENTDACESSGRTENPPSPPSRMGPDARGFESLPSPQANLEDGRVAAAEARLETAIAVAATAARAKMITETSLVQQKAQLKHVQQQQASMKQDSLPWLSTPGHQQAPIPKDTSLSPTALSYFPPTMTSAALQQHARQQHAQRLQDGNPALAAQMGDDAQLPLSGPSLSGAAATALGFSPTPLPCRPPTFLATGTSDGVGDVGFSSDNAGWRSEVTMRMPQLPQAFPGPTEGGNERERAKQQTQEQQHQQGKPLLLDLLDDEHYHGLDALATTPSHNNNSNSGFGDDRETILSEVCVDGGTGGSNGCGDGPTLENDGKNTMLCAVTTSPSGDDECLGAVKKGNSEIAEGQIDVAERAGVFLETLESATCRKAMVTLEVEMGSALQVMSEGKFLELHNTQVREHSYIRGTRRSRCQLWMEIVLVCWG